MKKLIPLIAITAFSSFVFFASCKKDEGKKDATVPPITNPEEQITTVILLGHNHDDQTDTVHRFKIQWEDLDGSGGNAPIIDSLVLDTGIEYHTYILLIDKTKTPWDTISTEVEKEKNVHQFFYTPSVSLNGKMKVEILDFDNNTPALPVGLEFHMNITAESAFVTPLIGKLGIVLSHYDGIPKTAAPSPESDIDIAFPVRIK